MTTIKPRIRRVITLAGIAIPAALLGACASTSSHADAAPIRTTTDDLKRYRHGVGDDLGSFLLAYHPQGAPTATVRARAE